MTLPLPKAFLPPYPPGSSHAACEAIYAHAHPFSRTKAHDSLLVHLYLLCYTSKPGRRTTGRSARSVGSRQISIAWQRPFKLMFSVISLTGNKRCCCCFIIFNESSHLPQTLESNPQVFPHISCHGIDKLYISSSALHKKQI